MGIQGRSDIGGTGTWNPWLGNVGIVNGKDRIIRLSEIKDEKEKSEYLRNGICLPFVPYPKSHAASNCLGLPNDGDKVNSDRARLLRTASNIPVAWSVMGYPGFQGEEKLNYLIGGMQLYELEGIDFLEINESCPNTAHGKPQDNDMANRLKYIKEKFLDHRSLYNKKRQIPVVVKFSNDTEVEQIPYLLDTLFELGYDGVNFGNTSTAYDKKREMIDPSERKLYDFFTKTFGGGVSGRPLKESSLELSSRAVEYLKKGGPSQEFHIIRTGGIENWNDIEQSERAGISLNQWYTGYFEYFAKYGHHIYRRFYEGF